MATVWVLYATEKIGPDEIAVEVAHNLYATEDLADRAKSHFQTIMPYLAPYRVAEVVVLTSTSTAESLLDVEKYPTVKIRLTPAMTRIKVGGGVYVNVPG